MTKNVDLSEDAIAQLQAQANEEKRALKNHLEFILESAALRYKQKQERFSFLNQKKKQSTKK